MSALRRMLPNLKHVRKKLLLVPFSSDSENSQLERSKIEKEVEVLNSPKNISDAGFDNEGEHFRYLLRNSNFINMGDPENKIVWGKVFHVVRDDLYIDFGWKFYCVCTRPPKDGELYVRGTEVMLRIKELELSTKFLGAETGLTILEADAHIVKLLSSPAKQYQKTVQ